jgi:hypothetical protein
MKDVLRHIHEEEKRVSQQGVNKKLTLTGVISTGYAIHLRRTITSLFSLAIR